MLSEEVELTTVNGGEVVNMGGWIVEILGPGYSTHSKKMVVIYGLDNGKKISIMFDGEQFILYKFKSIDATNHYYSKAYPAYKVQTDKRYNSMASLAMSAYYKIF